MSTHMYSVHSTLKDTMCMIVKIFQIKQILEFYAMIFFYFLLERFLDLQMTCWVV